MKNLTELFNAMKSGDVDFSSDLPIFGNPNLNCNTGIWSWDDKNAIVGSSQHDVEIKPYKIINNTIEIDWENE